MSTKKSTVIKITKSSDQTAQLETFVNNLGVKQKVEIYKKGTQYYINVDLILPVLSVGLQWFLDNAESTIHYIVVKKRVYVNKYGLTKLLAQSKEKVAFQLQDYIYEVIYKLEKNKTVSTSDIESRKQLALTMAELDVYRATEDRNLLLIETKDYEIKTLSSDIAVLEGDFADLKDKYNQLIEMNNSLSEENRYFSDITKKMAKYIKHCTKAQIDEVYEIDDSDEDAEFVDKQRITRDAQQSKTLMESIIAKKKPAKSHQHSLDYRHPPPYIILCEAPMQ